MNRREFILSSAAAAAVTPNLWSATSAPTSPIPAIDTHTHFYDPTRPQGVPSPSPNSSLLYRPVYPEEFRKLSSPYNVVGTVVVEASEWVEDNAWVLALAESNPGIVGLIGNLRPGHQDFAANLERFSANPLFLGLRLRGLSPKEMVEDAALADIKRVADRDQTIDIHGGPKMLAPAALMAKRLPSLRIVLNHLPFNEWDGDPAVMRVDLQKVAACSNIFIKVSNVVRQREGKVLTDPAFYRPQLDVLLDQFGPHRLVFGSNWPVSNQTAPFANVHGVVADYFSTQSRGIAENYFWRNSHVAYRWIPRGLAAALLA
jgi:L-fuconolactonase